MDLKQLLVVVGQVAKEKGIEPEKIISVIEESIAAAYRKEYGKRGEIIKAKLDQKTGEMAFWQVKEVVDESTVRVVSDEDQAEEQPVETRSEDEEPKLPRYNPERHIFIDEAKKINPDAKTAVAYIEASIGLSLMISYVLQNGSWEGRSRLRPSWDNGQLVSLSPEPIGPIEG